MNRILKAVVRLLAAIYFLVDAIFLTTAKSLANWIAVVDVDVRKPSRLDYLPPALSHACIVCFACGSSGASEADGRVFGWQQVT